MSTNGEDVSAIYVFGDGNERLLNVALAPDEREQAESWIRSFVADPISGTRTRINQAGVEVTRGAIGGGSVDDPADYGVAVILGGVAVGIDKGTAARWADDLGASRPGVYDVVPGGVVPVLEG